MVINQYDYPIGPPTLYEHMLSEIMENGYVEVEVVGMALGVDFRA